MSRAIPRFCIICRGQVPTDKHDGFCSLACRLKKNGYGISSHNERAKLFHAIAASTAWRATDLDPVMDIIAEKVGVASDIHCPLHSEKWLRQFIVTCMHYNVNHILVNGDLIDANQISRHAGSYHRRGSELGNDLDAAEHVLRTLTDSFEHVYMDAGNHDMRMIHKFGGEMSFQRAMKMIGTFQNLKVTSRSFVHVNHKVLVAHPRQYKKARGQLAAELAQLKQMHVLTGHQHHSAKSASPDARWQACDVGCIADTKHQDYVRNEANTFSEPMQGFSIIHGTLIEIYDQFFPFDLYNIPNVLDLKIEKLKEDPSS